MRRILPFLLVACPVPDDPDVVDDTVVDTVDVPDPLQLAASDMPRLSGDMDVVPGITWTIGEPVVCANPTARQASPYVRWIPSGDFAAQAYDTESNSLFVGGGIAVADVNGDDRLDILTTAHGFNPYLWIQGDGLTFDDASDQLPAMPDRTSGVTLVDLDDDGDLDAVFSVFKASDVVLENDGTGHFTDITEGTGLAGPPGRRSMSSSWADMDGDGDLDGFVAGYGKLSGEFGLPDGDASSVFLNEGDGTYTDLVPVLEGPHPLLTAHTFTGTWIDVLGDQNPELFLVNDFGWVFPTTLLTNEGGLPRYTNDRFGLEMYAENMGVGVGDVDGDGTMDFFVNAWDDLGFFVTNGDEATWYEVSQAAAIRPDADRNQHVGWGAELADVDNDGDLDVAATFGHLPVRSSHINPEVQHDALWLNDLENLRFADVAEDWGVDDGGRNRAVLAVDLDRDGFLDLIKTDLRGPLAIYRATCDDHTWLELELRQNGLNPFAIGARVTITDPSDTIRTRDVLAGGHSYGSSGPPEVHVGLGDAEVVTLAIRWPDGRTTYRSNVPTNRRIRVERRR